MFTAARTTSADKRFQELVKQLDADLAVRDGENHALYNQYNGVTDIKHALVAMQVDKPVGCGALKFFEPRVAEVKRIFTPPENRGKGIASFILQELEAWAKELGYEKCVLETGKMQPEAIALYKKSGYCIISNYGQYAAVNNSICFEKTL